MIAQERNILYLSLLEALEKADMSLSVRYVTLKDIINKLQLQITEFEKKLAAEQHLLDICLCDHERFWHTGEYAESTCGKHNCKCEKFQMGLRSLHK